MRICSCLILVCLLSAPSLSAFAQDAPAGPSFNCKYAKNQAEQTVCATPELAALDRELANVFNNTINQGGVDAAALRRDEMSWVRDVRNACTDAACLKGVYQKRIQQLRDQSQKTASPAAYDEARPFPVSDSLWTEVRSYLGKPCTVDLSTALNGFGKVKGFLPVTVRNAVVHVRAKQGIRFAFLLTTKDDSASTCHIADAVTLPSSALADTFLSCSISDMQSYGVGMRLKGHAKVVAYWEINAQEGKLLRQPLGVLDAEKSIRCNFPESGE